MIPTAPDDATRPPRAAARPLGDGSAQVAGPTPTGRAPVAAIVLAFNEERNLSDCLASLAGWVEELFVVDSGSTDRTVEIARAFGARVVEHPFEHYGAQRNWALETLPVTSPWVLNVDSDERITPELRDSIVAAVGQPGQDATGFMMSRRTMFMGRWIRHGGHYPAWHLRLFRTGRGRCEDRLYDQHFYCDGVTRKLHGDLIDTLTPDIATFSVRHVRWAHLEAEEQEAKAVVGGRVQGRLVGGDAITTRRWLRERYARLPLFVRPVLYFTYRYFFRAGFLDGREGLIFHFLQGFWYRFLVDAVLFERSRSSASRE
jgi:glycosyltransferase involved in cell wall biosynthesis